MKALFYGIAAFAGVTAAFCVALSIALGGPPTASEGAGMQTAANDALKQAGAFTHRAEAAVCRRLPRDARALAVCADAARAHEAPVVEARRATEDPDASPAPVIASNDDVQPVVEETPSPPPRLAHAPHRTPPPHLARHAPPVRIAHARPADTPPRILAARHAPAPHRVVVAHAASPTRSHTFAAAAPVHAAPLAGGPHTLASAAPAHATPVAVPVAAPIHPPASAAVPTAHVEPVVAPPETPPPHPALPLSDPGHDAPAPEAVPEPAKPEPPADTSSPAPEKT